MQDNVKNNNAELRVTKIGYRMIHLLGKKKVGGEGSQDKFYMSETITEQI